MNQTFFKSFVIKCVNVTLRDNTFESQFGERFLGIPRKAEGIAFRARLRRLGRNGTLPCIPDH